MATRIQGLHIGKRIQRHMTRNTKSTSRKANLKTQSKISKGRPPKYSKSLLKECADPREVTEAISKDIEHAEAYRDWPEKRVQGPIPPGSAGTTEAVRRETSSGHGKMINNRHRRKQTRTGNDSQRRRRGRRTRRTRRHRRNRRNRRFEVVGGY